MQGLLDGRQGGATVHAGGSADGLAAAGVVAAGSGGGEAHLPEIRRLLKERAELLLTGVYTREDPLVLQLDQRVAALAGS